MSLESKTLLPKLAGSSLFIFFGTIVSLLISFLTRVLLVRFTSQSEYGVYVLAFTVVTISTTLSTLGFQEGLTRHISHFRGKNDTKTIEHTIYSAIIVSSITSIFVTIIILAASNYISMNIFKIPELSPVLKLFSLTIPFSVIINVLIATFRAFNIASIKVYLNDIFKPLSYLIFLVYIVISQLSFIFTIYSYVVSIIVSFFILIIYFFNKSPTQISWNKTHINKNTKDLLKYSLPLLAVTFLLSIMSWTDTLMLGYLKTEEMVASYNAAYPVAHLLAVVVSSIGFIYVPIISILYGHNDIKEIRIMNSSSTKWSFMLTYPFFVLMFVFPDSLLNFLYGYQYINASGVLQVLVLGSIMNSYFGLNYYTLLSTGRSTFLMICSLFSALLNIVLNLILIPKYGMFGAAIASSFSFTVIELYMTIELYRFLRIHPFTKNYLKITLFSLVLFILYYIIKYMYIVDIYLSAVSYIIFLVVYVFLVYYTKSLDEQDLNILKGLKNKVLLIKHR